MAKPVKTQCIDLRSLTQMQVAWLIGRPPAWLRARAHLFERDGRGLYDGRKAVEAFISTLPKPESVVDPEFFGMG